MLQIDRDNWYFRDFDNDFLVSVESIDFPMLEHGRNFISHDDKELSLLYMVHVCISFDHLVWINGPFPCDTCVDSQRHSVFTFGTRQAHQG